MQAPLAKISLCHYLTSSSLCPVCSGSLVHPGSPNALGPLGAQWTCRDGEHLQIQVVPHWHGMLPPREAARLPRSGDGVILRDVRDRLLVLSVKHHPTFHQGLLLQCVAVAMRRFRQNKWVFDLDSSVNHENCFIWLHVCNLHQLTLRTLLAF